MNNETPLQSWKEIGAYLQRDSTTARRWEKEEGLPVHRHSHKSRSSVYAYPSEIDAWRAGRTVAPEPELPRPLWKNPAFAVTLALCLIMVGNGIRPQVVSAQALTKRLVCEGACAENTGDLSPDAKTMVITEWGTTGDLAIRDLATGQVRRLLVKKGSFDEGPEQDAYAANPLFSPDTKQVVYLWWNGKSGDERRIELRVSATEQGAVPRTILSNRSDDLYYDPLAWSPDGRSVLLGLNKTDETWQMAWVSLADGSLRQLVSLGWRMRGARMMPTLSPDGRYIAYGALAVNPKSPRGPVESDDTRIYVMAADGSNQTELVKTAGIHKHPVWSSDGRHVLFTSDQSGQVGLWSIPVQDGKASGPAKPISLDMGDVWVVGMRAGSLFYTPARTAGANVLDYISIARLDGVGTPERFVGLYPSWSPDGKLLAFTRFRPGEPNQVNVVVHNMETGEETVYGQQIMGLRTAHAVWFPDGGSLLKVTVDFEDERENVETAKLWRLDLKTGQFTEVVKIGTRLSGTDFLVSRDSRTLYLALREAPAVGQPFNQIITFDLATGRESQVFTIPKGQTIVGMRLSPDGRTILYRSMEGTTSSLALVSTGGEGLREIYRGERMTGISWTPDGRGVLFAQQAPENGRWRVMRVPAEGGAAVFTGLEVSNQDARLLPAPHPDGVRAAYSARDRIAQLWALDNLSGMLQ